jgi:hypothetical protein
MRTDILKMIRLTDKINYEKKMWNIWSSSIKILRNLSNVVKEYENYI